MNIRIQYKIDRIFWSRLILDQFFIRSKWFIIVFTINIKLILNIEYFNLNKMYGRFLKIFNCLIMIVDLMVLTAELDILSAQFFMSIILNLLSYFPS